MAFIKDPFEEQKLNQPGQSTSQQSGIAGGEQVGAQAPGASPSNWTNLNAYIDGNQGAGKGIADTMTDGGDKKIGDAVGAVGNFTDNTKAMVDQNTNLAGVEGAANYTGSNNVGDFTIRLARIPFFFFDIS